MLSPIMLVLLSLFQAVAFMVVAMYILPMILFMWARAIAAGWKSGISNASPPPMIFSSKRKGDN